ncbi:MAG: molybdenum cofactor guanylyltransferase [Thermomicrobiales bacterium]
MTAPLSAAILVGGRSTRMGQNKALLRLTPNGPSVIQTIVGTLTDLADEVFLAGTDVTAADYAALGLRHVPDVVPNAGALGGIHAALGAASHTHILVVACDMPFLNAGLLAHMAGLPRDYDALVPLIGRPHPLHAIYARAALPVIETRLVARRFRVTGWFASAKVQIIPRATFAMFDPDLRSCFNMNGPDDFARAQQIVRQAESRRMHHSRESMRSE